mmetsp:Transcript_29297/g.79301  ORF Transcript_29297/g.79301 Transcript_29297/m.79301 type:complete len:120 (-) Transcript_29297:75-434(-)
MDLAAASDILVTLLFLVLVLVCFCFKKLRWFDEWIVGWMLGGNQRKDRMLCCKRTEDPNTILLVTVDSSLDEVRYYVLVNYEVLVRVTYFVLPIFLCTKYSIVVGGRLRTTTTVEGNYD